MAGFGDWDGGRAIGPRYLVPAIPLFALAAIPTLRRLEARGLAALAAGVALSSTILCAAAAFTGPYASQTLVNPLMEVNVPVLLSRPAPSVLDAFLPRPFGLILAALALAALAVRLVWNARRTRATIFAVCLAAAVASHIVIASIPSSPDPHEIESEQTLLTRLLG